MATQRLISSIIRLLVKVVFRPRVRGANRIPPAGGFVISANHLSGFDFFALSVVLGKRRMRCMAKNQLFAQPLLSRLIRFLGAFPAHANLELAGGVDEAARLAAAGEVVVIFPEGRRRRGRTDLDPKTGAARTARAAGVPLVPVAIRGTDGWRRLARWSVEVGEPISAGGSHDGAADTDARLATSRLWDAVAELEASLDAGAVRS
jgi:1-acyl-sn-glycerol-3-phosphate acyltransferase